MFDSSEPDYSFVVMSLDEYERTLSQISDVRGLTEEEMLDKINRDVAIWRSENEMSEWDDLDDGLDREMGSSHQDYDRIVSDNGWNDGASSAKRQPSWSIPKERKSAAEEVIEEDRHYLEEVPF